MTSADLLQDAFTRIKDTVHRAVDGLGGDELAHRLDADANTIGWLVWHLTRIQDDHLADVAGLEQVWTSAGWSGRFGLPFDVADTGYGHSSADVAAVRVEAGALLGYHDAVCAQTLGYVRSLDDAALERVVDTRWDPPVTLAVRLVSVISDDLQHAGQAALVRGVVERQRR